MGRFITPKPMKDFTVGTIGASTNALSVSEANVWCNEVLVQNHPDSAARILLGNADEQLIVMEAGDSITLPVDNVNSIYVATTASTATVNYLSRGLE